MKYRCALVTGASSGLGREFAMQLASRCGELVLVARREERLRELAAELRRRHVDLRVRVMAADLVSAEARENLLAEIAEGGNAGPDLLVNNAGMGDYGEFATGDWQKIRRMVILNMEALTHLSHALLPGLVAGKGAILNVSSLAGDLPIPDFSVYAATKAYVSSFSEALRLELRDSGVRVMALCPGPVATEFGAGAEREKGKEDIGLRASFYEKSPHVVAGALRSLEKGRARHYPGAKVALAACGISLLPLCLLRLVMGRRPRRVADS